MRCGKNRIGSAVSASCGRNYVYRISCGRCVLCYGINDGVGTVTNSAIGIQGIADDIYGIGLCFNPGNSCVESVFGSLCKPRRKNCTFAIIGCNKVVYRCFRCGRCIAKIKLGIIGSGKHRLEIGAEINSRITGKLFLRQIKIRSACHISLFFCLDKIIVSASVFYRTAFDICPALTFCANA